MKDSSNLIKEIDTIGYNPVNLSTSEISTSLEKNLIPVLDSNPLLVERVYFYGAGCSSFEMQEKMQGILGVLFPNAVEISVMSDLWACIHSSCGQEAGICCILGTGSNACVFDGQKIVGQLPSLGYILGDEGSGNQIGKALLRDFFYGDMPEALSNIFREKYKIEEHDFVKTLYAQSRPNRFLASFALFAAEQRQHPFIQELIKKCFDSFVTTQICKLQPINAALPLSFVGSIAAGFEAELRELLAKKGFHIKTIQKSPFPGLLQYY